MEKFLIEGGATLNGEVSMSGSKNAALPIMAACLLTDEPCTLRGMPELNDVRFMGDILAALGAEVHSEGGTYEIQAKEIRGVGDYDLIRKMRGSICIMGPLLGRLHYARVSMPGGCVIGTRPIDLHLKGMKALGGQLSMVEGDVEIHAPRLQGTTLFLGGRSGPTVLGTANVLMAAVLAEGETVIESAACEPEIIDLVQFLRKMGAQISGEGGPTLRIQGVPKLHGAEHQVIPDRIEAGTFLAAVAATGGRVTVRNVRQDHLVAVSDKLREAGVSLEFAGDAVTVFVENGIRPVDVTTMPYPGFPTDMQAQLLALMCLAPGTSILTERIYESRFMHAAELMRLGADIAVEGSSAIVKGQRALNGAPVMASDLRASAALVIAGLAAEGITEVHRIYHLDRGYERMEEKLSMLGAKIWRVPGE
jgi:UDP-N-acetylglucosamine 1-carboxyvinyltransferase